MKRIVVGLVSVCLLGSLTVLAQEKAATPEKSAKKEVDITVMGKLAKSGHMGYTVTDADGSVARIMPVKPAKEGETAAVQTADLDKLVGKDVKLVGKGFTKTHDGKKTSVIKTVTSVEEAPAAAAPAAAAAPEAK